MGREGKHITKVKLLAVASCFLMSSNVWSQNFNDAPGRDDEKYLAMLFPKSKEVKEASLSSEPSSSSSMIENILVDYAMNFLGVKYKAGGVSEGGFDCSGFMLSIFNQVGISLPHSSGQQAKMGEEISYEDAKVGDLIFFTGSNKHSGRVGHVGMVCEVLPNGEGVRMIHSTVHGGIMIDNPMTSAYFKPRYLFTRRVLNK